MSWLTDLFSRQEIPQSSAGREPAGYNSVRAAMMNKYFQQMLNPYGISSQGPPPTFHYQPFNPWGSGGGASGSGGFNPVSGPPSSSGGGNQSNPMLGALMQPPRMPVQAPGGPQPQGQNVGHFDGTEYAGKAPGRESAPIHPPRPYSMPKYGPSGGAMGMLSKQLSGVGRNNRIGQLQANRTSVHPQTYDGCTNPVHYGGMVGGRPVTGNVDPGPQGWGSVGGPNGSTFTPNAATGVQPLNQPTAPPPPPKNTGGPPVSKGVSQPPGNTNNSGVMPGGSGSGGGNSGSLETPGVSLPPPGGVNALHNTQQPTGVRNYGQPNSGVMPGTGGNQGGFDGEVYDGRKDAMKAIHGHADLMKKILPLLLQRGGSSGMGGMGGPGMGGPSLGVGPMGGPAIGAGR